MNTNELMEIMDDLLSVLNQLRDAAFRKQRALIENSFERIEASDLRLKKKKRLFWNCRLCIKEEFLF